MTVKIKNAKREKAHEKKMKAEKKEMAEDGKRIKNTEKTKKEINYLGGEGRGGEGM